uniref:Uncharacterized protein n=1 Tax=Panagrolaimus davidi TaxID=227884 RepID=A0A914P2R0_9BILA
MPCLSRDILFDVGEKIIENGDSGIVTRFTLSGKQSLQAMKNDQKCYKLHKSNLKFFTSCIGNSVIDFHINFTFYEPTSKYQRIIDKVIDRKQLESLSIAANLYIPITLLNKLFTNLSSTLKKVSIPDRWLSSTFRDVLDLDSLTVLNASEHLPMFCCKTKSFTIDNMKLFQKYIVIVALRRQLSEAMKYFSLIESIKYNIPMTFKIGIRETIASYNEFIKKAVKIPPKFVLSFYNFNLMFIFPTFNEYKQFCEGFEYNESIKNGYCFCKNVQSGGSESTVLEIQFPK